MEPAWLPRMPRAAREARAGADRQAATRRRPGPNRRPHHVVVLLPHDAPRDGRLASARMASTSAVSPADQHAADKAMTDPGEIGRCYDRCSDLTRELLDGLAQTPGRPRTFPDDSRTHWARGATRGPSASDDVVSGGRTGRGS